MNPPGVVLTGLTSGPEVPNAQLEGRCGRKMATIILDLVAMPVLTTDDGFFTFPELTYNATSTISYLGYQLFEFDLASVVDGIGLTEVRSVMVFSRPTFSAAGSPPGTAPSDGVVGSYNTVAPLLTNVRSFQTVSFGTTYASYFEEDPGTNSFQVFPFFGTGASIPCRILCGVNNTDSTGSPIGKGKYQLIFCNWDVSPCDFAGVISGAV
jgi:hypothetical protein